MSQATAFDGSIVPASITAPCGNTAHFNREAGYGYRCEVCLMVVGSMECPCPDMSDEAVSVFAEMDDIPLRGDRS